MARTYVPTMVLEVRQQAIYIARYGSVIRAAIAVLEPAAVAAFDAYATAVVGLNAFFETLYPTDP